jgi:hypothetical protein
MNRNDNGESTHLVQGGTTLTIDTQQGSPQSPTVAGSITPSTQATMDAAVQIAQAHKDEWINVSLNTASLGAFLVFGELSDKFVQGSVHAPGAEIRHRVRDAVAREKSQPCRTSAS